jgi:hypothetical protein
VTIADQLIHGTTHKRPAERFAGETLRPLKAAPPYRIEREPARMLAKQCLLALT